MKGGIFTGVLAVTFVLFASPCVAASKKPLVPVKRKTAAAYQRNARAFSSALVIDSASGKVLYAYEPDRPWPLASLTKLMGALVFVQKPRSWNHIVALSTKDEVGGGRLRVKDGATLSIRDVLYSSVTASANNAAMALARISGMTMPAFVRAMNEKAKTLHLTQTTFVDPSGMDPGNVSTAHDIAALAKAAFANGLIRSAATTAAYQFVIRNTGELKKIRNTDEILTSPTYKNFYIMGGKTGFLYESMHNLVVHVRPQGTTGKSLMVVVLGSPDTTTLFRTAAGLATWAWSSYAWNPS